MPFNWKIEKLENVTSLISRGPSLKYSLKSLIPVLNQKCIRNREINLTNIKLADDLTDKKNTYT